MGFSRVRVPAACALKVLPTGEMVLESLYRGLSCEDRATVMKFIFWKT